MKTIPWTDPIVDEVHRVREEIAREANYDLHEIVKATHEETAGYGGKRVSLVVKKTEVGRQS